MKILVFSDSHNDTSNMLLATQKHIDSIDLIIHLGDHYSDAVLFNKLFPHVANINILGNCDFDLFDKTAVKEALFTPIGSNFKLFACHGHRYNVKDNNDLIFNKAYSEGAKIALYGHTHIAEIFEKNGIYIVNPGSISLPRGNEPPSYAIINIENNRIMPSILFI